MAIWKSISSSWDVKFYKLRLKWWARFAQSEKNSEWKYEEIWMTKIINGALKSVSINEWEYEWNPIYSIKFTIKDTNLNETYIVDVNAITWLWRSIMSSLLSLKELWKIIELSLYNKKYTDKTWKPAIADAIWLTYNESMLKWKYNIADKTNASWLPEVKEVEFKWKKELDSMDRDKFLLNELQLHIETLSEPNSLADMPWNIKSVESTVAQLEANDELDISDIPF